MRVGVMKEDLTGNSAPEICFRHTMNHLREGRASVVVGQGSPKAFVEEKSIDVLHRNKLMNRHLPVKIPRPVLLTYHGDVQWERPHLNYGKHPLLKSAKEISVDLAKIWQYDSVCFPSADLEIRMQGRFRGLLPNSFVTPNAPPDWIAPDYNTDWLAEFGIHKPYVLHVSARSKRKNPEGIVEGFNRSDAENLEVIGSGWGGRGHVPNSALPQLYTHAEAFLFPSYHECFGLPPVEALACGTPVVVSDRYSLPEVVGDAGFYCNPDDHDSIAQAINNAIASQQEPVRMYNWADTAEKLEVIYNDLC